MMRLAFVSALVASSSATQWFAAYDLSENDILAATQAGCYRGNYGGVLNNAEPRTMSLLTCPSEAAQAFAETPDNAFLCVVELKRPELTGLAMSLISNHKTTKVLFQGRQEIVIVDTEKPTEKPAMCCRTAFRDVADNTMYVPVTPIREMDPTPLWHPRVAEVHAAIAANNVSSLQANPEIERLLRVYSRDIMVDNVRWLGTGYDGRPVTVTRNSYSIRRGLGGCTDALITRCANNVVDELEARLRSYFAGYTAGTVTFTQHLFRTDMCNNLIVEIQGADSSSWIVTGAHLDSRNTNSGSGATGEAPGADDNGSGSAIQAEMARVIGTENVPLGFGMRIMWFCGEEQGLLGSRALASSYRQRGDRLLGMFNMDMIGYKRPNLPTVMAFMTGSASRELSNEIKAFSAIYVPTLQTGDTTACCSDQQSFHAEGFRAAGIFETPTAGVVYPQYHRTGDTHDNGLLDYTQIYDFARALFSAILEYAQIRP